MMSGKPQRAVFVGTEAKDTDAGNWEERAGVDCLVDFLFPVFFFSDFSFPCCFSGFSSSFNDESTVEK